MSHKGWRGWHAPDAIGGGWDWIQSVIDGGTDAAVLHDRPGSRTYRVELGTDHESGPPRVIYVKHTRCGLLHGLTHFNQPAAWRVARTTAAMRRRGFGVPTLRYAVFRVGWKGFENVVVMESVPGESLISIWQECSRDVFHAALRRAAVVSARLHDCGFSHGDLLPGNLYLSDASPEEGVAGEAGPWPDVVFIDNDRSGRVLGLWRVRARFRNVSQMCFKLRSGMSPAGGWIFLRQYLKAMRGWEIEKRWVRRAVIQKIRLRSRDHRSMQARSNGRA